MASHDEGWNGGGRISFLEIIHLADDVSDERKNRQEILSHFFEPIKSGVTVQMPRERMFELMKDFKREGNDVFREKHYVLARDHYTCSLLVARQIEDLYQEKMEKELISTLFTNRAACHLKIDMYLKAVEDCDIAIGLNKQNLKAFYRRASALKYLKKYEEASRTALFGKEVSEELDKKAETKEFELMLREINSHLPEDKWAKSGDFPSPMEFPEAENQKPALKPAQKPALMPAQEPAKAVPPHGKKTKPKKDRVTAEPKKDVDESWLAGTNVNVSKKQVTKVQEKTPKKPKRKAETRRPDTKGHLKANPYASLREGNPSSSSEEEEEEEEVDSDVPTAEPVAAAAPPPVTASPRKTTPIVPQSSTKLKSHKQSKASEVDYFTGNMGLDDDFAVPNMPTAPATKVPSAAPMANEPSAAPMTDAPPTVKVHHSRGLVNQPPNNTVPRPRGPPRANTPDRGVSGVRGGVASPARPPTPTRPPAPLHKGPPATYESYNPLPLPPQRTKPQPPTMPNVPGPERPFVPLVTNKPLTYPFNHKYDFTFACGACYQATGIGPDFYICLPELEHGCSRDIFLCREKKDVNARWYEIRERPQTQFFGQYRLCNQFLNGRHCKVPQHQCSFAHNEIELHLWSLDRSQKFDIIEFTNVWSQFARNQDRQKDHGPSLMQEERFYQGPNNGQQPEQRPQQYHGGVLNQQNQQANLLQARSNQLSNPPQGRPNQQPNPLQGRPNQQPIPPQGRPNQQPNPPQGRPNQQPNLPQGRPNQQPNPLQGRPNQQPNPPQGRPNQQPNPPQGRPNQQPNPPQGTPHQQPNPTQGGPFQQPNLPQGRPNQQPNLPQVRPNQQLNFPLGRPTNQHYGPPMPQYDMYPQRNNQPVPYSNMQSHSGGWTGMSQQQPGFQSLSIQNQDGSTLVVEQYVFPLQDTHVFRIVCLTCLQPVPHGQWQVINMKHRCPEDTLAVKHIALHQWIRVRERTNHRNFYGRYMLCRFYSATGICHNGDFCSFAHSEEEQILWTLEKDNVFNITEFILQNRSQQTRQLPNFEDLFRKHPGWFQFICRACFYTRTPRISVLNQDTGMCSADQHYWQEHVLMVHVKRDVGEITAIANRPFRHPGCFYRFCHMMQFCIRKQQAECKFAHSMVERDVWLLERDFDISRTELIESSRAFLMSTLPPQTAANQQAGGSRGSSPAPAARDSLGLQAMKPAGTEPEDVRCPFRITELCGLCWNLGKRSTKDKSRHERCNGPGMGHMWSQNRICMLVPENKIIRALPKKIPLNCKFIICKHIREKRKCNYSLGGQCQFAHSEQEVEVWVWMVKKNVRTLDDLVKASQEAQVPAAGATKLIPKGQTVVWAKPLPAKSGQAAPQFQLSVNSFYCHYCSIELNSQKQWDEHCASEKHQFSVNTDKEHQWNYRQPPWGVRKGSYELCTLNQEGKCRYSHKPDMYNFCKFAHSQLELDEWKERYDWRQMKREIAKKEHMYSFMEEILEEYAETSTGISVLTEELPNISVTSVSEMQVFLQDKNSQHVWVFDIITPNKKPLQRVALLHNKDRIHFGLAPNEQRHGLQSYNNSSGSDTCRVQISPGDVFLNHAPGPQQLSYTVKVQFTGGMFGSFMQWVAFDFDSRPVLVRKLGVELGAQQVQEKVKRLREHLTFDRWTGENRIIIPCEERHLDEFPLSLLKRYKPPSSADAVITQQSVNVELNRHNYVHKMHKLLEMEEMAQAHIIASFNLECEIEVLDRIQEDTIIQAFPGELFAKVPLNDELNEDIDAGKLILNSVQTVILAVENATNNKVYEAKVVTKEIFNFEGRGKDYIYICLSPRCVRDLELQTGSYCAIELQFQMNRLPFCLMHFAVDQLENNDVVFPDASKINPTCNENKVFKLSSDALNTDQLRIVEHIMAEHPQYAPPIVVYGPFGTGKTETLAQAAMLVVKQNFEARVLICSHSNSAADLYITKHFDAFTKRNPNISILRVYATERRVNTVSGVVRKYCLLNDDGTKFKMPLREEVLSHHIVITTLSTSLFVSRIRDLQGFFTHIFIDEAAQAYECEAIMPLSMATENTCVVLAGDHMQMGPKVYSKEAKFQQFHKSLLERLFHHYDSFTCVENDTNPLNVLLSINYRNKMEILRFLSAIYYGGPDKLHCASGIPDVDNLAPLNFYTANGLDVQDPDSTTFYNMAEVEEVGARVEDLLKNWPEEWGEKRPDSIGVLSPYAAQVNMIRRDLRKRRLGSVTVERVMNVQGKEFRALFLSTVRTVHIADQTPNLSMEITESDGDVGDFGFLSDNKLLNTALTRAQSFVGIVGDPVALCVIGDCASVWRAYLKHCQNMRSIFPEAVSLQTVRSQVQILMNSPQGQNIQILNSLSQDIKDGKILPKQKSRRQSVVSVSSNVSTKSRKSASPTEDLRSAPKPSRSFSYEDEWTTEVTSKVKSDDIIKQLAKDAMKVCKQELARVKENIETPADVSKLDEEPMKLEYIKVQEDEGHAVLTYAPTWTDKPNTKKRTLLGADDHGKQFEYDENNKEEDSQSVYVDFTIQQLTELVASQPDKFKYCTLHIESSNRMYAKVLNPTSAVREIKIGSRLKCGRGFDNDEVVVELLDADEEQEIQDKEGTVVPIQGKVVGILKRAINPQYRLFVCMVEEGNTGMMVPLNRGIPKMFNLETGNHLKKTRRGHVCVYSFTKDKEITFDHYEPVNPTEPMSKLFIVRYLKWDAEFFSPLGIVVGSIPAGTTVETGLEILNLEHFVPQKFNDATEDEVAKIYQGFSIPPSEVSRRIDFRDRLTFTIDPTGSEDLDDAISIDELANGKARIGIHIADVGYFVRKGNDVDVEALSRGVTYYPTGGEPIPMLPPKLSTNLCSLKPKQDRLTISLFVTVNSSGRVSDTQFKSTVINSKCRLDYEEAERLIGEVDYRPKSLPDKIRPAIRRIFEISQVWRQDRLGNQGLYTNLEPSAQNSIKAHVMVEELMIMANHQAALSLMQNCPSCTPLRTQLPPNELELDDWRQRFRGVARNTIALLKPFLSQGAVCNCTQTCSCIKADKQDDDDLVSIRSDVWHKLISNIPTSLERSNLDALKALVCTPENSPEMTVALLQLRSLQELGTYVNISETTETMQHHYSLNLLGYVHFTSPIRRYVDLVVHRLLAFVTSIQSIPPYSEGEIITLCTMCMDAMGKAKKFENASNKLQLAALLQNTPVMAYAVVETVDDMNIQIRFPTVRSIPQSQCRIAMPLLGLAEKPLIEEDNVVTVRWQERIYDTNTNQDAGLVLLAEGGKLNPDRHIIKIPVQHWRNLLYSVVRGNFDDIKRSFQEVNSNIQVPSNNSDLVEDVSSEVRKMEHSKHFSEFSLQIRLGTLIKVQLSSELFKGVITPRLQLLELTPTLDICLEHRSNPASCFASITTLPASKPQYRDEDSYESAWLRVLSLEAAHCSINDGDGVIIHNIDITWRQIYQDGAEVLIGSFVLPQEFCSNRRINFSSGVQSSQEPDSSPSPQFLDYFCVRYKWLSPGKPLATHHPEKFDLDFTQPYTWVGHCLSTSKNVSKDGNLVKINLQLHHSSIQLPSELLTGEHGKRLATIEFIPKSLPHRRQEAAIRGLSSATSLAKQIALGRKVDDMDEKHQAEVKDFIFLEVPNLSLANSAQQAAVQAALTRPFTLIQGPPGTGKTVTGVRIACLFTRFNKSRFDEDRKNEANPQVMYCGPSNKSVDVVTGYLKKLGLKIVRVYSESIEAQDFPGPTDHVSPRRTNKYAGDENVKTTGLHYLIRKDEECTLASIIREFDEKIQVARVAKEPLPEDQITLYRNLVEVGEQEVLRSKDIILCTCNASGMRKIRVNTNIKQLMIDECGMCTEPESMIPIVMSTPNQVVLIGDHKQLRPVIQNDRVRKLGLETSLFERYSYKALMLTQQYRMHEAIAEFPSLHFYDDRLECGRDEQKKPSALKFWPNGRNKPISFIHVIGQEQALTVSTDEGREQSRSNSEEVTQAVKVATHLVRRFHVPPKEVVVLSQYRAQCARIEESLGQKNEKDINVSTVVASQGSEWDYVILSTVRSLPKSEIEQNPTRGWCRRNLGFITDDHQINVAISRARKGLIIIGNKNLLSCDSMWNKLLQHYHSQRKVVRPAEFMQ